MILIPKEKKLIRIGYWYNGPYDQRSEHYPVPHDHVDEKWFDDNRDIVCYLFRYLMTGQYCNAYRGNSKCRICSKMLGSHEYTDGTYIWPEGLEHYLEHHVRLPDEFVQHIMDNKGEEYFDNIDETFWLQWGKK